MLGVLWVLEMIGWSDSRKREATGEMKLIGKSDERMKGKSRRADWVVGNKSRGVI
jgi:hypothetical protein